MFKPGGKQGPVVEKRPKNCPNDGFLGSTLMIEGKSLVVTKFLAQGGFAFVYVATNPVNLQEVYAIKRMIIQTHSAMKDSLLETYYHVCFNEHPNVVKLYAARIAGCDVQLTPDAISKLYQTNLRIPSEIVLIMELCAGGSIVNVMQRTPNDRFSEDFIWHAFGRVVSTVCMMGSMGIINRDLKIENILVSCPIDDGFSPSQFTARHADYLKVCDFGSCTKTQYPDGSVFAKDLALRTKVENEIQKKTTPSYRAPEMIDFFAKFPITIRSDVFALGVILYRLMYFSLPFPDGEVLANFNCKYRIPTFPAYSDALKQLISVSLIKDPMQRADVWYLATAIQAKTGLAFIPRPAALASPQIAPQAAAPVAQDAFFPAQPVQTPQQDIDPYSSLDFGFSTPAAQLQDGLMTHKSSCASLTADEDAPLFGFNDMAKPSKSLSTATTTTSNAAPFGLQVKKSTLAAAQGFQLGSGTAAAASTVPAFRAPASSQQPTLSIPSPTASKGLSGFVFEGKPMFASQQQQMQPPMQQPRQPQASPVLIPEQSTAAPAAAPAATNMNLLLNFFGSDTGSPRAQQPQQPQQQPLSTNNLTQDLFGWESAPAPAPVPVPAPVQPQIPSADMEFFNRMTPEQKQVYTQQLQIQQQMLAMQNLSQGSK